MNGNSQRSIKNEFKQAKQLLKKTEEKIGKLLQHLIYDLVLVPYDF